MSNSPDRKTPWWQDAMLACGCLLLVFGVIFAECFTPEKVVFANDAPLAAIHAHAGDERLGWSNWQDLNWVGYEYPSAMPKFTQAFFELCRMVGGKKHAAVLFAKWHAPLSLVLLGFCAWLFFRVLKFPQPVCILGALAIALNGDLFSYTVWGLPSVALGVAGALLAMAAVIHGLRETGWRMAAWVILGGCGLGQGVMESFDVGGIFSIYVALFVVMAAINRANTTKATALPLALRGMAALIILTVASALMAGHALGNLMRTEGGAAARAKAQAEEQLKEIEGAFAEQIANVRADPQIPPSQKKTIIDRLEKQRRDYLTNLRTQPFDAATQWSVPPMESLRMIVPGLYGFRDNPHGWMNHPVAPEQQYWGRVGQSPGLVRLQAQHSKLQVAKQKFTEQYGGGPLVRHGSSGIYMGVLVLIGALWALLQACRGADSVFDGTERRWMFFWATLALGSLLLAWGHHAPFYALIYKLPFFNIIRNPIKFMHPCALAVGVMFAYGLAGMARAYLDNRETNSSGADQLRLWLKTLGGWERNWALTMAAMVGLGVLTWLFYWAMASDVEKHLVDFSGFSEEPAKAMAAGSWVSMGMAAGFAVAAVIGLGVAISGLVRQQWMVAWWTGMGVLLVADLALGSRPHLVFFDYRAQYASNDVVDILKQRPFEQRVAFSYWLVNREIQHLQVMQEGIAKQHAATTNQSVKAQLQGQHRQVAELPMQIQGLNLVYQTDWKQGLFPFYKVHAADVIQEPRPDPANTAYRQAVRNSPDPFRELKLTSTRYLLGNSAMMAGSLDGLLEVTNHFTVRAAFDLVPAIGRTNALTANVHSKGKLALVEFERALPRAGLYANWRSRMDDEVVLATLPRAEWDPHREVLIAEAIPAPESADANASVVPVRYLSYDPKRIVLETDADATTVLLLNDKHHHGWRVTVDGQPAKLLRANFLMRGVHLPAGKHKVEFRFAPEEKEAMVSLAGFGLGAAAFLALLFLPKPPEKDDEEEVVEVPPEQPKDPSGDLETPTAPETSSPDEPPKPSRRKSRSRSGRRKKR